MTLIIFISTPNIFTDKYCHTLVKKTTIWNIKNFCWVISRLKISVFVKHVVGWKKLFVANPNRLINLPVFSKEYGAIKKRFSVSMIWFSNPNNQTNISNFFPQSIQFSVLRVETAFVTKHIFGRIAE